MTAKTPAGSKEIVACWEVPLSGIVHRVEFEHGTTTGKRVLWVDGKEIFRRDWMFKLVGDDFFNLGPKAKCIIKVDPLPGFRYSYTLYVNGKSFRRFSENQSKALRTWLISVANDTHRVVLEKDTLNVWVNGRIVEEEAEFIDGGTETQFTVGGQNVVLTASTSGNRREGIVYTLTVNGGVIPELSDQKEETTDQ